MWAVFFGFLAGFILAVIFLWTFVCRRARAPLLEREKGLLEAYEKEHELRAAAERKADEYFGVIDGVVKERTTWAEKYQKMAVEYGNSQDLFLHTIEGLCRQLEKLGKKVEIPAILKQLRAEFFGNHLVGKKESVEKPAAGT